MAFYQMPNGGLADVSTGKVPEGWEEITEDEFHDALSKYAERDTEAVAVLEAERNAARVAEIERIARGVAGNSNGNGNNGNGGGR